MLNKPKAAPTPFSPIASAAPGPAPIEGGATNVTPLQRNQQSQNPKYAAIQEMMAGGM